jgi:hypothetical protein
LKGLLEDLRDRTEEIPWVDFYKFSKPGSMTAKPMKTAKPLKASKTSKPAQTKKTAKPAQTNKAK